MGWIVPELGTDFPNSFSKMILDYIFAKWALTGNLAKGTTMRDNTKKIQFKAGFFDRHRPFEVAVLKGSTEVETNDTGGYQYQMMTHMQVGVRMKRLARDSPVITEELSKMENEVQRIIGEYQKTPQDITGIKNIYFRGDEPDYDAKDSWASSEWRSVVNLTLKYEKRNNPA